MKKKNLISSQGAPLMDARRFWVLGSCIANFISVLFPDPGLPVHQKTGRNFDPSSTSQSEILVFAESNSHSKLTLYRWVTCSRSSRVVGSFKL
jgi:hypothetical protein